MNLSDRYLALPARLRAAIRIWIGVALLSALMPASATNSLGVLAQPWFWAVCLPLLALLPYRELLLTGAHPGGARRVPRRLLPRRTASQQELASSVA